MANLLLILVSRINMTLAATAIICSHAAFVLIPVLFLLIPPHQGLSELLEWFWGLFLPSPLASSLLQLTHALSTLRETERGASKTWWERKRAFPLEGCKRKESPSAEEYGPYLWGVSCPPTFSALNPVFKSAQPCTSGWNPLGKGSCLADEIRKGRETPLPTHARPVKPLWLLLISPHLSCHSCFFTQSLLCHWK